MERKVGSGKGFETVVRTFAMDTKMTPRIIRLIGRMVKNRPEKVEKFGPEDVGDNMGSESEEGGGSDGSRKTSRKLKIK